MKSIFLFIGTMVCAFPLLAQKEPATLASNLNLSKSNINRIVYPGALISGANALLLLNDLEKTNLADQAAMKAWLVANFKRFNADPSKIKQILILPLRQYKDCTVCAKFCKGRCVQDPGADCVCIQHSEPNLKYNEPVITEEKLALQNLEPGKRGFIVSLSMEEKDEMQIMEAISKAIAAQKPGQLN